MRSSLIAIIGVLIVVSIGHAEYLVVTSFDALDNANRPIDVDVSTAGSGVSAYSGTSRPTEFGGSATSSKSWGCSTSTGNDVASIQPRYDITGATLAWSAEWAASFALGIAAGPSSGSTTFAGTIGFGWLGCNYRLKYVGQSSRWRIEVRYGTTTLYESADYVGTKTCSTDRTIACNTIADCPSGSTCDNANWWEIETYQNAVSAPVPAVQCELYVNGRPQHPEGWLQVSSTATELQYQVGKLVGGEPPISVNIDDLVIARDHGRIGAGYVGVLYPNANAPDVNSLRRGGCSGATGEYWWCIQEWMNGGLWQTTFEPALRTENANRTGTIAMSNPPSMTGAAPVLKYSLGMRTGSGTSSNPWTYTYRLATCSATACDFEPGGSGSMVPPVQARFHGAFHVVTPTDEPWTQANLDKVAVQVKTTARPGSNYMFYWRAGAVEYYVPRPKPGVRNLRDHDIGENDGQITVALVGDSLTYGTASVTCSNDVNRSCRQDTYCSWDAPDGATMFGDLPHGGCTSDTECRTCTGRRASLNGGAGAPCTSDAQCPETGGSCNTAENVCNQNENIPCTVDADCNGWGGTCDTTATCVDACPGGDCPVQSAAGSWANVLCQDLAVDNCIQCGLGGERVYEMIHNRWESIITGQSGDPNLWSCNVVKGSWAQPDYIIMYEGANDLMDTASYTPECQGITAVWKMPHVGQPQSRWGVNVCGPWCTEAQADATCLTDAECQSAVGPMSRCVGATRTGLVASRGDACTLDVIADSLPGAWAGCSMRAGKACATSADCLDTGQPCIDPIGGRADGFCGCTSDAQCGGSGWRCVGGRCRRECTADSQCSSPTRAGSCRDTGAGYSVCVGRCTCSCDARTCTTDADCDLGVAHTILGPGDGSGFWFQWPLRGQCQSGRCRQCGMNFCRDDYPFAYRRTMKALSPARYAKMLRYLHRDTQSRPDGTPPDGLPVYMALEPPDWPMQGTACGLIQLYDDPGYIRQGIRKAKVSGVRVIEGLREKFGEYYATGRGQLLHTDWIHNTVLGAQVIAQHVRAYLDRLNVCRITSTDQTQKYCYLRTTQQYTSTTCVSASDCSGDAVECRNRPCASESDCPASDDSCVVE